ncbi:MAG: helicase-related protein [Minisyncoccia bacterium]
MSSQIKSLQTKFIANDENSSLFDKFRKLLPKNTQKFDILVGYLYSSGFKKLIDYLDNIEEIRLIVGMKIDKQLYEWIKDENQLTTISEENKNSVKKFLEFVKSGKLKIKSYPHHPIHAKMYIFHSSREIQAHLEGIVITGSSNFTQSGLEDNIEINVILRDSEDYYWAKEKFESLWQQCEDISEKYIQTIEKYSKFASKTPYQIFLKSLYELQKEVVINALLKNKEESYLNSKVELTEFQQDAVVRIKDCLKKFNAALVADSVGLGKTWIANKIAEEFGYFQRRHILVICPAQLSNMWEKAINSINVPPNILTQEKLASMKNVINEFSQEIKVNQKDISLIIVDESHNFRNPFSNRHINLAQLIDSIKQFNNNPKILFLTATPINNTVWDLYYQLNLMLGTDRAFLKYGIENLADYFKKADKQNQKLGDVLHLISIRRNRNYIKQNYPDATIQGQPIKFPERILENINYKLKEVYQGVYKEITDLIEKAPMAYYRFIEFKKDLTELDKENLQRMVALTGIFRTILLKRLESSVEAFRKSVLDQLKFLNLIGELVKQGKMIDKTTYQKIISAYEDEEALNIYDFINNPETKSFEVNDYRMNDFLKELENDIGIFNKMYNLVSKIKVDDDAKLKKLEEEILKINLKNQLVIFTYYSDTLDYIFDYFSKNIKFKDYVIRKISGKIDAVERNQIINEFSSKKIHILFSTDVLSEGQNLQTAQSLINYDLHWNPTRMIQRAGRIDRLMSPYDKIYIYNFFPENELEDLLRLVKILQDKIRNIDNQVGLDQSILGEAIHPKVFGTIARIKEKDTKILDEEEDEMIGGRDLFWEPIIEYFNEKGDFDEVENLPFEIYSGKKYGLLRGIYFYYKYADDWHYWYFYDLTKKSLITDKEKILEIIRCQEDEKIFLPNWQEKFYEIKDTIESEIEKLFLRNKMLFETGRYNEFKGREEKFILDGLSLIENQIAFNDLHNTEEERKFNELKQAIYKIRKTKRLTKELRGVWMKYKNNRSEHWREILNEWHKITHKMPVLNIEDVAEFDRKNLKLVAYEFIE